MEKVRAAELRVSKEGPRPVIDVAVPHGTTLMETFKLHDVLSKELTSKLSPRGCEACNSGVDIYIHEMFDEVIRVDLNSMKIIG
ncbi:MAG: hypothetical protein WBM58_05855 [Sedimenticolaceae bacterium]